MLRGSSEQRCVALQHAINLLLLLSGIIRSLNGPTGAARHKPIGYMSMRAHWAGHDNKPSLDTHSGSDRGSGRITGEIRECCPSRVLLLEDENFILSPSHPQSLLGEDIIPSLLLSFCLPL
ncbi:hypothetical protein DPX16_9219 [Anabarilius grahami]|uniref:Uncharacterized protein n=1 Tax=Anabarilius grahami TaxID=495550 RepID=A0A3N0Y751_ANAGA|nr:hypothetical protein DPX16_9219 [Anabarilius grahami]